MSELRLFDAHCHLDDRKFRADLPQVLKAAEEAGVEAMLCCGANMETSASSVELANEHKNIYAAVGVHPHDAKELDEDALFTLEIMTKNKKVVAIGEIGLDYYRDLSPRDLQRHWFIEQIKLANKLGMPIVIHDRDANGDVFEILREYASFENGVQLHSYSGSAELARQYVKLGAYISISGPVTYKNASEKREVVKTVPIERILVETDSPYLTPEPKRGMRNEPAFVAHTLEKVAELKGMDPVEAARITTENAYRFFRIEK